MSSGWKIENAKANFHRYREQWQSLSQRVLGCDHPLANADYVEPLLNYLGDDDVKIAVRGQQGEDGLVLLRQLQTGVWGTFAPHTGPFTFCLIPDENGSAEQAVQQLIRALPGLVAMFTFHKLDPDHLVVHAENNPAQVQRLDYFETLQIPTDRPFDEYWSERSRNLRRNIIKKTNRLNDHGIVWSLKQITDPEKLPDAVRTYGEIEQRGWKGEAGTAVDINDNSGSFYVEMLDRFAARGQATAYQLIFDNEPVASAITIKGCGMMVILKITFDEAKSDYSPGLLMMYELHKVAFMDPSVEMIEYYGKATQRAQQWAVRLRTLYHLDYYRSTLARKLIEIMRQTRSRLNKQKDTAS